MKIRRRSFMTNLSMAFLSNCRVVLIKTYDLHMLLYFCFLKRQILLMFNLKTFSAS